MERTVEILIGRLIMDAAFRRFVLGNPRSALQLANEWGIHLSEAERLGVASTDPAVWERAAREFGRRARAAERGHA